MYNPEVVSLIASAKSYNYSLPTIRLMAYVESAITYNPGSTVLISLDYKYSL